MLVIQMSEVKSAVLLLNISNSIRFVHRPRKGILTRCCRLSDNQKLGSVTALQNTALGAQKRCDTRGV